jgi:hypothetical protein
MCHIRSIAERGATLGLARPHPRPFVGAFQGQFAMGLSTFDDNSPQDGSNNGAERGWDNPTQGLLWFPEVASWGLGVGGWGVAESKHTLLQRFRFNCCPFHDAKRNFVKSSETAKTQANFRFFIRNEDANLKGRKPLRVRARMYNI